MLGRLKVFFTKLSCIVKLNCGRIDVNQSEHENDVKFLDTAEKKIVASENLLTYMKILPLKYINGNKKTGLQ